MHVPFLTGGVGFTCDLTLEEAGRLISESMLGGIPFVGLEDRRCDEVPCVYAEHRVLGLFVYLQGYGGERGYALEAYAEKFSQMTQGRGVTDTPEIDISGFLALLLTTIEGFTVDLDDVRRCQSSISHRGEPA